MESTRIVILVCLLLLTIVVIFVGQQATLRRINKQFTQEFSQTLQKDLQPLNEGGGFLTGQADFDNVRFTLSETQSLEDSSLIPLITVPITTQNTSFLLVLAVKTRWDGFTSFGQSSWERDQKLFTEHVYKVFASRGNCQVIIEIDHHVSSVGSPNSWSETLKRESSLHVSKKFGRLVLPTNLNIVSCQK